MKKETVKKKPKKIFNNLQDSFTESDPQKSKLGSDLTKQISSVVSSIKKNSLKSQSSYNRMNNNGSSVSSLNSSNIASSLTPVSSISSIFAGSSNQNYLSTKDNMVKNINNSIQKQQQQSPRKQPTTYTNKIENGNISTKEYSSPQKKEQQSTAYNFKKVSSQIDIVKSNHISSMPEMKQDHSSSSQLLVKPKQSLIKRGQTMTMQAMLQEEQEEAKSNLAKRRFSLGKTMAHILNQSRSNNGRDGNNDISSASSSFIENKQGLPLRLHGKIKYHKEILKIKKKIKWIIFLRAFISILAVGIIQLENDQLVKAGYVYTDTVLRMKIMITVLTLIEVVLIIFFYYFRLKLLKYKNDQIRQKLNIFKSKYKWTFMIDMILHLFVNPPGINISFTVTQQGMTLIYTWDTICACISLLRLHILIELIPQISHYTQDQAKRLCNQNGTKANTKFSWKAMMKTNPYIILAFLIVISVLVFGIIIRNLERANMDREGKLDYMWDAFWVVMIVMLTIGYGDITIDTNISRIVFILCILWGILVYSFFIVSVNVLTNFDDNETSAYKEFQKLNGQRKLKPSASKTIANFILFNYYLKKKQRLINHTKSRRFSTYSMKYQELTVRKIEEISSTKVFASQEEDIEKLLQNIEFSLYMSQNEQTFFLEKFDDADVLFSIIMNNNQKRKETVQKIRKQSYQLYNLSRLISEFGARFELNSLEKIQGSSIMSMEQMNNFNVKPIESEIFSSSSSSSSSSLKTKTPSKKGKKQHDSETNQDSNTQEGHSEKDITYQQSSDSSSSNSTRQQNSSPLQEIRETDTYQESSFKVRAKEIVLQSYRNNTNTINKSQTSSFSSSDNSSLGSSSSSSSSIDNNGINSNNRVNNNFNSGNNHNERGNPQQQINVVNMEDTEQQSSDEDSEDFDIDEDDDEEDESDETTDNHVFKSTQMHHQYA